jgi:hypothetical protein
MAELLACGLPGMLLILLGGTDAQEVFPGRVYQPIGVL